jgi:hypothetical protein
MVVLGFADALAGECVEQIQPIERHRHHAEKAQRLVARPHFRFVKRVKREQPKRP